MKRCALLLGVVVGSRLLAAISPAIAAGAAGLPAPEHAASDRSRSQATAEPVTARDAPADPQPRKRFFVGPRIGLSPLSGMLGIEVQYKQVALDYGFIFLTDFFGVKYFFSDKPHSAYLAGAYSPMDDDRLYGVLIGYQARSAWGFSASAGAGVGVLNERNDDGGRSTRALLLLDLTIGYSLGFGGP